MAAQPPVGFVGLGHMGWPMARHLSRGGVELSLYDALPGRAQAFAGEFGGQAASDLAALAGASVVVITMLPNGDAVRDVALGTAGRAALVDGLLPDAILADMGSSDPEVYAEIAPALARRGAHLIDAPVSGAVSGAEAATLTIMAGGDPAAIERATPLFDLMGERVFRTGPLGSAQAMKALNNLASAGAFLLTLEVLLIGQRFGLDPKLMTEILNVSTGRNNATDKKILPHVLSRRFDSGFALAAHDQGPDDGAGFGRADRDADDPGCAHPRCRASGARGARPRGRPHRACPLARGPGRRAAARLRPRLRQIVQASRPVLSRSRRSERDLVVQVVEVLGFLLTARGAAAGLARAAPRLEVRPQSPASSSDGPAPTSSRPPSRTSSPLKRCRTTSVE